MKPIETVRKYYKGAKSAEIHEYFSPKTGWKCFEGNIALTKPKLRELAAEGVTVLNLHVEDRFGGLRRPDLNINNFDLEKKGVTVDGIKVDLFPHHYGVSSLYFDELRKDKAAYGEGLGEPHTYLKWDGHEVFHSPPDGEWDEYGDKEYLDRAPTGTDLRATAKVAVGDLLRAIESATPENTGGISPEALSRGEPLEIEYFLSARRYPKKNSNYRGWMDECGMSETGSEVGGTFAHLTVVDEGLKKKLKKLAEDEKKVKAKRRLISDHSGRIYLAEEELRKKEKEAEEIANRVGTRTEAIAKAEREFDEEVKKLDSAREEALRVKEKLEALKEDLEKVKEKEVA